MKTRVESSLTVRKLSRLAHLALVLLGVLSLSRPLSAQLLEGLDTAGRVLVSRNEVRVYFPPPPVTLRNSSVTPSHGKELRIMRWVAYFDTPTRLSFRYIDSVATDSVPPLLSIVRAGRVALFRENMVNQECSSENISATLENGGIVLSYRDTAEIRQAFGLRPEAVMLSVNLPPEIGDGGMFAAPVRYIDPLIVLDPAERVAVVTEHRRREASIHSYSRWIDGGPRSRTLSMHAGDSVDVWIQESECLADVCGPNDYTHSEKRDWGRGSLSDSSVAGLHPSNILDEGSGFPQNDRDRARKLVARRPGRSTLRITGVHTAADTMPSRTPLDSILEREIIVTPRRRRP